MFGDGPLTFREFATREPLPLATIHDAMLQFLRGRLDAILCGAHAVNAYIDEPRMTDDVDLLSVRAADLAAQVRAFLRERFHVAVRVHRIGDGISYRVAQVRKPKDRPLVDIWPVLSLPAHKTVEGVLVLAPAELICSKLMSRVARRKSPEALMDLADLRRLLLAFPELKTEQGPVADYLRAANAKAEAITMWKETVAQEIFPDNEDDKFAPWSGENE